ncbi:MAG: alpha/beta hydrolase [Oscillospiraceae bacterium]|nr:alpha/beta hydrolase [Oscillospiraceae bacterium]
MNDLTLSVLKAISKYDMDLENNYQQVRQLERLAHPFLKRFGVTMEERLVSLPGREILLRVFETNDTSSALLLFFHGGGFVIGDFDSYNNVCATLASQTGWRVVSVDYRLAPENRFPAGVEDCYAVTQQVLEHCEQWYHAKPEQVVLIGDSAGATLSCVSSFLCRDRGGRMPAGQVLIYPSAWGIYDETTPFASVAQNGSDYILTRAKLLDYMNLYASCEQDRQDPRFAPLRNTDYSGLPRTLLLTMEFDPLRDEGEALGRRMREGGTDIQMYRIESGIHGIFRISPRQAVNALLYQHIKDFLHEIQ